MHKTRMQERASRYLSLALTAIAMAGCGGVADDEDDFDAARMFEHDFGGGIATGSEESGSATGGSATGGSATSSTGAPVGSDTNEPTTVGGTTTGDGNGSYGSYGSYGSDSYGTYGSNSYGSDSYGTYGSDSYGSDSYGTGGTGGTGGTEDSGDTSTCNAAPGAYVKPANYPANYPPGWINKIHLETCTQCGFQNWVDSDGVDPETPGCHQAYENLEIDPAVVAIGGGLAGVMFPVCSVPTNDRFGEECENGDVLLETNPGKNVCHAHPIGQNGIGVGHPDRFSCNAYCDEKYGLPGECRVAQNACENGLDSAYCLCGC